MMTLRDLTRCDKAIASITSDECHFIASVLLFVWSLQTRWYLRWLLPRAIREEVFKLKMISAVLGRTPKEREPHVGEQIRLAMEADRRAAL